MPLLTDEAREFFREAGRRGGHAGNHAKKGCGASRERSEAMKEINRTRRTKREHGENCWCDLCARYWRAKNTLKELNEKKVSK